MDTTKAENSLTIRRMFNAPRQKVFDAWTKPELLLQWWRAHPDWSTSVAEVDLRVGGKYRLGMQNPNPEELCEGEDHICQGEFVEVHSPERLSYTWNWEPPGTDIGNTLVTVEFNDLGEQTEIVLTHERFPAAEAAEKHSEGWTGCLGVFESFIES